MFGGRCTCWCLLLGSGASPPSPSRPECFTGPYLHSHATRLALPCRVLRPRLADGRAARGSVRPRKGGPADVAGERLGHLRQQQLLPGRALTTGQARKLSPRLATTGMPAACGTPLSYPPPLLSRFFCRSYGSTWRWMPPKVGTVAGCTKTAWHCHWPQHKQCGTVRACSRLGTSTAELSAAQLLPRPAGTAKLANAASWPCVLLHLTAPLSPAPRRHAGAAQPLAGGAASRPQRVGAAGSRLGCMRWLHVHLDRSSCPRLPPPADAGPMSPTRAPMQAQPAGRLQLARQGAPGLLVPRPAAASVTRFAGCGAACRALPQTHGPLSSTCCWLCGAVQGLRGGAARWAEQRAALPRHGNLACPSRPRCCAPHPGE